MTKPISVETTVKRAQRQMPLRMVPVFSLSNLDLLFCNGEPRHHLRRESTNALNARLHYLINYPPVLADKSTQSACHNLKTLNRY